MDFSNMSVQDLKSLQKEIAEQLTLRDSTQKGSIGVFGQLRPLVEDGFGNSELDEYDISKIASRMEADIFELADFATGNVTPKYNYKLKKTDLVRNHLILVKSKTYKNVCEQTLDIIRKAMGEWMN